MQAPTHIPLYPLSPQPELAKQFIGHRVADLPAPAIVLDRAKIARNCEGMLRVCRELDVGFRAHVKSHKTLELSKMQVGDEGPANFIVSTVVEAEHLLGYVKECQDKGRESSILYGVPCPQSALPRLLSLAKHLAPRSIHIIIDNLSAYKKLLDQLSSSQPTIQIGIFIKVDTGYHRAGLEPSCSEFPALVREIASSSSSSTSASSSFYLKGFYSHYGHSYAGSTPSDALIGLVAELRGLENAVQYLPSNFTDRVVLSVGATPTATSAQNVLTSGGSAMGSEVREALERMKQKYEVELHAGVYPLLDLQQVATCARPRKPTDIKDNDDKHTDTAKDKDENTYPPLSKDAIAIKLLVEISSVYTSRSQPQALISCGTLALGREPCKSYPGWGIVSNDLANSGTELVYDEDGARTGWIVGSVSQEHGLLKWEGDGRGCNRLEVGDKVLVWPNHACVAAAGFGWYFIVNGDDKVVDVWSRWRGW